MDDEGALLHRQLTRLDRKAVVEGHVVAVSVVDPQLGGIALAARIHQCVAEDGNQLIPLHKASPRNLIAVKGKRRIVVDLGCIPHRDLDGSRLDRHGFGGHGEYPIPRQPILPLLVGDGQGGYVGSGGGGGRAPAVVAHGAGQHISLGQIRHHGGTAAVLKGGVLQGKADLPRQNGEITDLGVDPLSRCLSARGAHLVVPGEFGLLLRPRRASLLAVFVDRDTGHKADPIAQLFPVGDLGGAVRFRNQKTLGHDQGRNDQGRNTKGDPDDQAVGIHSAEYARNPFHPLPVAVVLHRFLQSSKEQKAKNPYAAGSSAGSTRSVPGSVSMV